MPRATDDTPWTGPPQFVVGLDIGTTHSSVTFSHLIPGQIPSNQRVTHWPGVTGAGSSSDAKTPSKLYYDSENRLKGVGATVNAPSTRYAAKNNNWRLVRYFKLLLHPPSMSKQQSFHFEALPAGLTVERVYADMIRHMLDHTQDFFERSNGAGRWRELSQIMTLVIAHPNGWGLKEQERLRSAVILSGVMDAAETRRRVKFVPEAEAAVHYILWEKSRELQPGAEFIICDAGGSTVDTTAYRVLHEAEGATSLNYTAPAGDVKRKKGSLGSRLFRKAFRSSKGSITAPILPPQKPPVHLKELKASDCQPAGGVFVNEAFIAHLKDLLFPLPPDQNHRLEQCLQKAEESFELNCKREYDIGSSAPTEYIVDMGAGIGDHPEGHIVLGSETVKSFFEEPVRQIIASIRKQLAGTRPSFIFLVGGFGTSKYLRQQVMNTFRPWGIQVLFLDDAHGKAASDGSIIWYIRQGVVGRAARMSFGLQIVEPYDPTQPEHRVRNKVTLPSGVIHVSGRWDLIIRKDEVVDEKWAIRRSYVRSYSSPQPNLGRFTVELFAWINATQHPHWITDPDGNLIDGFELIGEIEADLSGLRGSLQKRRSQHGDYWALQFDLCLEFGGVELVAYLEWKEKQMVKRSETTIVVT